MISSLSDGMPGTQYRQKPETTLTVPSMLLGVVQTKFDLSWTDAQLVSHLRDLLSDECERKKLEVLLYEVIQRSWH